MESTSLRKRLPWGVVVRLSSSQSRRCAPVLTRQPHLPPNARVGTVFQGVHTVAGKEVAIKVEPAIARSSPLKQETKIYKTLMGGPGVPWLMWAGKQGDYNVMVVDLLGPSLEDLFRMCNRYFSLKTVLLLADQLVSRISIWRRSFSVFPYPPPRAPSVFAFSGAHSGTPRVLMR